MLVPHLARRFLLSKESDGFISLIAWVSILGVALGVLALVVVTSVINGFEGELSRVITAMNGDVILYTRTDPIHDPAKVEARVRELLPSAVAVTSSFVMEMMVVGPGGAVGGVLEGVDPLTVGKATSIPERLQRGRMPRADGEVVLGSALAERLNATEGTSVRLVVPSFGDNEESRALQAKVVGIVKMGMYEYDSRFVFALLDSVRTFLRQPGAATSFKIRLRRGADTAQAAEKLSDAFGFPFRARDWASLNRNLLYAIQLEKAVISIILTAITLVAAFNVVSTLMMMIHDKTREIAILKAMGLRPGQGFRLFCAIGLGMGLVGTLAGSLSGLGLNWLLDRTRLIELPSDIYYIGFLPVVTHWGEVFWIACVAMTISFLATLYPAWQVARRAPLEGLRYD